MTGLVLKLAFLMLYSLEKFYKEISKGFTHTVYSALLNSIEKVNKYIFLPTTIEDSQ